MKDKLYSFLLGLARKIFTEKRLLKFISVLLDILYGDSDPLEEGSEKDV